jgi:hypothetical protein
MCLDTVDKKVNRKHLKRKGKYVICWKVVSRPYGWGWQMKKWRPRVYDSKPFKSGWNESSRKRQMYRICEEDRYIPHFHAWTSKSAAESESAWGGVVVRCKTFLKYITATGTQSGRALVTSKIWIPPYPETE